MISKHYGLLICLYPSLLLAKSLGIVGSIFPVEEENMLQWMKRQLQTTYTESKALILQKQLIQHVNDYANHPSELALYRTTQSIHHQYIPDITLVHPLVDANGKSLYPAGTHLNALQQLPSYYPCWLFFNANDTAQINWAKKILKTCSNPKLILTGGNLKKTKKQLNLAIYFDQYGRITQKLGITHVPALVMRKHNTLDIHEMAITDNGNEQ